MIEETKHTIKDMSTESNDDSGKIDIDNVLELSGLYGRFQYVYQLFFTVYVLPIAYHTTMCYFIGNEPAWKCVPNSSANTFCEMNLNKTFSSENLMFSRRCELGRGEWTYVTATNYSFVTEFDLVCQKTWIAALASGAFFIGGLFGSILSGIIADKYGRKIVMIACIMFVISISIACSYVSNIWQLVALRALLGAMQMSGYSTGFIALSEVVPPTYRPLSGGLYQASYGMSQFIITLAAFYEREWRKIQFYLSFPALVPLLLLFFLPNSPRWLLSVGKRLDAEKKLKKIATYNGVSLKRFQLKSDIVKHNYTYLDLFTNRVVIMLTLAQVFIWGAVALVYFTIAFASSNLGGNMYQAFALSAVADLPSYFVIIYTCNRFGRKKSILGSIYMSGILVGIMATIPKSLSYKYAINISLAMLARFFTSLAFTGVFIWSSELYPTPLRSQGFSLCIASERIGAFAAPFLISVLQSINFILPYIIVSIVCIVSASFGLILPETNKLPTRESYDDFFKSSARVSPNETDKIPNEGCDNIGMQTSDDTVETF